MHWSVYVARQRVEKSKGIIPPGSDLDLPPVTDDGRYSGTINLEHAIEQPEQPKPTVTAKRRGNRTWTKVLSHHIVEGIATTPYCAGVIQQREWRADDPRIERPQDGERLSLFPLGGIARRPAQLMPAPSKEVRWEKLTLTVDSGASDTVVPPSFSAWSTIFHTLSLIHI